MCFTAGSHFPSKSLGFDYVFALCYNACCFPSEGDLILQNLEVWNVVSQLLPSTYTSLTASKYIILRGCLRIILWQAQEN